MARVVVNSRQETDPLLPLRPASTHISASSSKADSRARCTWSWLAIVAFVMVIAIICDIGETLYAAPRIRLFESVLCRRYYEQHNLTMLPVQGDVPEHLCKEDAIQDELAALLGAQLGFDSLPAILLPIPYGFLANKYGRKWILAMGMLGYALSYIWTLLTVGVFHLPLQWTWLLSTFFLLGGGPTVATTINTIIVADVVPPEIRSTVFFYRFCTDLIADLITPPIGSYLMTRDVWIPLFGAVLFQMVSFILVFLLPETMRWVIVQQAAETLEDSESTNTSHKTQNPTSLKDIIQRWMRRAESSLHFVTCDKAVAALVLSFLISKVGRQSTNFLFQYVSKRYGWTLSQAGLLVSLRSAVNLLLYTVILPVSATLTLKRVGIAAFRDLVLARGSILLLLFGSVLLAVSATPIAMVLGVVIFTLGAGFSPAARSLVTFLVDSQDDGDARNTARLYALISVAEGTGSLVAALGMSWTLRLGIRLGSQWLGLPFGFAAVLFLVVTMIVFTIGAKDID